MALYLVRFEMPVPPLSATVRLAGRLQPAAGERFEAGLVVEADNALRARHVVARLLYGAEAFHAWVADGRDEPFTEVLEIATPELAGRGVWPPDGGDRGET
jgi:hypothetical protein